MKQENETTLTPIRISREVRRKLEEYLKSEHIKEVTRDSDGNVRVELHNKQVHEIPGKKYDALVYGGLFGGVA